MFMTSEVLFVQEILILSRVKR